MLIIDGIAGESGRELPLEQKRLRVLRDALHVLVERDAPDPARLVVVDRRVLAHPRALAERRTRVEPAVEEVDLRVHGRGGHGYCFSRSAFFLRSASIRPSIPAWLISSCVWLRKFCTRLTFSMITSITFHGPPAFRIR